MLGCSSCAMSCASRTNRSASEGSGERSRSRTLIATSRTRDASRQRNTAANPPSPSSGPTVNSSPTARWRRSCRTAMSMADGKRRNARRAALGIVALGVVWLLAVWPPPVWWRAHTPRCTAMMRLRSDCQTASRSTRYVSLQEVAPVLQRMVVIGEDSRFHTHSGVAAARLTADQAAALAATLPFPRTSNPVFQPSRMEARQQLILARFYGRDVTIPPVEEDTLTIPPITVPEVPPVIDSLLKDTILD